MRDVKTYVKKWIVMEPPPEEFEPAKKKARKRTVPRSHTNTEPQVEPHRPFVIRLLRSPLNLTLVVLCLSPMVIVSRGTKFEAEVRGAYLVLVVALMLYYLGHALFTFGSTWFKTQKRLSELLATIFFGASVLTILQTVRPGPMESLAWNFAIAFGWSFAGATWAWDRMRILGVDASRARLKMLVSGWFALPGAIGALVAFVLLILIAGGGVEIRELSSVLTIFGIAAIAALTGIPALQVELKLRKKLAMKPRFGVEKKGRVE